MAAEGPQQIAVPGQGAGWLKRYQGGARRWRLALLNGVVRLLRVPALQAYSHSSSVGSRTTCCGSISFAVRSNDVALRQND